MLIKVIPSNKPAKKYEAVFSNGKSVHFGSKTSNTYLDNGDKTKRENYLNRHKANEDWNNPMSKGSLSRWILWNMPSLEDSIKDFKKRFKLIS